MTKKNTLEDFQDKTFTILQQLLRMNILDQTSKECVRLLVVLFSRGNNVRDKALLSYCELYS